MRVLVVGGAGYIGSITAKRLLENEHQVMVLDNLCRGHKAAIDDAISFFEGDFGDAKFLDNLFTSQKIEAVMHFGAISLVSESVKEPAHYFENNVSKGITLLNAMLKHNVRYLVFSSTAAVYGEPDEVPITESAKLNPTSPYGESKLSFEKALMWYARAYDLKFTSLRYFNAAGAAYNLGEDHACESHLIPLVLEVALGKRDHIAIYGDDYATPDGTCVRDYIHVQDLADAHVLALTHMTEGRITNEVFNLGTSAGFSVKQIIKSARKITGHVIPARISPRRVGDPAVLIAANEKCKSMLGWQPRFQDVDKIISDAWNWHQKFPAGYADSVSAEQSK